MFFLPTDFNAFDRNLAKSEEAAVITARKNVAENRMRVPPHDHDSGSGLKDFFEKHRLYPHWQSQHLTNVYWPLPVANGGWVDYMRMGYGKERDLINDLARRAGVFTEITNQGERDVIAFHCATQLQLGLNSQGWWINLYIDKKGWLEQNNLIEKIASPSQKNSFIRLLDTAARSGYFFVLYAHEGSDLETDDADTFIEELRKMRKDRQAFSLSIEKGHAPDDPQNKRDILLYLRQEFAKLLPLYQFISWHPKTNHFVSGL